MQDIDAWCVEHYDDGHRKHLGASLIGHECKRYLWYVFRWCMHKKFDGRMYRLFNRGHREEDRFVEYLRGIGCQVWTHDETQPKNAKGEYPQYRISSSGGHFGGSLDGIALLPPHYGIKSPVLCEFKTNGTGAGFNALGTDGMPRAKPQHYAQTCTYGNEYKFEYCLYLNTNKNDDSIHLELVKLDWNLGEQMKAKADIIILSQEAPPRLSNNPTYKACAYCDMKGLCHEGKPVETNCRSCKHAFPRDNKEWYCEIHNATIPEDVIKTGCGNHRSINIQS